MDDLTVCVLLHGEYSSLAERCLSSLVRALPCGKIQDVRIGLNAVSSEVRDVASRFSMEIRAQGINSYHFEPVKGKNVGKYPLMRWMFRTTGVPPLPQRVMWFDDDSYLDPVDASWWHEVHRLSLDNVMVGQCKWQIAHQGNQWEWIQQRPWCNPELEPLIGDVGHLKGKRVFRFCQGAWWVAQVPLLRKWDWPITELHHNGGDSMLGELCRHQGYSMAYFDKHLHINADEQGRHSRAKRRGIKEKHVAWDYKLGDGMSGYPAHHDFNVELRRYEV